MTSTTSKPRDGHGARRPGGRHRTERTEAIERLRGGVRYDLVFCDLGMPDMNGWRVAREIQDVAPGTTVYMLTGWAQEIADDDPRRVGERRARRSR